VSHIAAGASIAITLYLLGVAANTLPPETFRLPAPVVMLFLAVAVETRVGRPAAAAARRRGRLQVFPHRR